MKNIKKVMIGILCLFMMVSLFGCKSNKMAEMKGDVTSSATKSEKMESGDMKEMSSVDKDKKPEGMKMNMMKSTLSVSEGEGYPVTITDIMGNKVTLTEEPKNVAVTSGTFLNLAYNCGGKSICTANIDSSAKVPDPSVMELPQIGAVYNLDVEKLLEQTPELVICQFGLQNGVIPALKQSEIPVLAFSMRTYKDVIDHVKVMGRIYNQEEKTEKIIKKMENDKNAILEKIPDEKKKVVIIYIDSKSTSVKLPNSIAGNVCDLLGFENIAAGEIPEGMGGESTPFSLEYIIEKDPDVILVTSMLGNEKDAEKIITERMGEDTIYKNLRAVKEGNIVYLPQSHFLYNAGTDFVTGMEYVAKSIYPELFK